MQQITFSNGPSAGSKVALEPDGKIVIAGTRNRAGNNHDWVVARLDAPDHSAFLAADVGDERQLLEAQQSLLDDGRAGLAPTQRQGTIDGTRGQAGRHPTPSRSSVLGSS